MKGFKAAYKRARQGSGLTQEQACKRLGVSVHTFRKWEQGVTDPDVQTMVALAGLYGVSLDELVGAGSGGTPPLADDEAELVRLYRDANAQGRAAIMAVARASSGVEGQAAPAQVIA